jgi:hypothetical protein
LSPAPRRFKLLARISSENPVVIKSVLEHTVGERCTIVPIEGGFEVSGELKGSSARDLNRWLLSEMRRAEKKTRIRAEWTSGETVEKFFDYVPKGTRKLAK